MFSPILSLLEVKVLDAISKDKEEEEDPTKMSNNNNRQKVIVITQVFFEVSLDRQTARSRYLNK